MLTQITIDDIARWQPCENYQTESGKPSRAKIRRALGNRDAVTPLEVLDLDVPPADRLWVVLRNEVLDKRTIRLIACDCAERVLPIYEARYPGDDRPRRCAEVARRYARGESTSEDLDAARAAARAAASAAAGDAVSAADYAARAAARAAAYAAWAAACDAASDAAWDAARAAAGAARAAAGAAERLAQIEIVRGYLAALAGEGEDE